MGASLRDRLLGFGGLGGLQWFASIFRYPGNQAEDLAPEAVAAPRMLATEILGRRVAYLDLPGDEAALPLVFLHGFGESTRTWDAVLPAFAGRHRVVAVDLWGFGASARPPDMWPEEWIDQVQGLLDHLGLDRAVLLGHSLGGCLSLMTAHAAPERVAALVLCNADWGQAPLGYFFIRLIGYTAFLGLALARLRGSLEPLRRLLRAVVGPTQVVTEEQLELIRSYLRVQGTLQTWTQLARRQRWARVHRLADLVNCPALVVWGEDDALIPVGWGEELARRLSRGELVRIPHCGHFPEEERPAELIAAVREFLEQLEAKEEQHGDT